LKKSLRAGFKRGSMAGVATLGASALLLTGCGAAPSASGPSGSATASDYTACMVSDSGGFDDKSFNQSGYEGLQSAVKDLGIQEKHVQSKADTDYDPNLRSMVQQGCKLTVTVGFLLGDATKSIATANPNSHFAIIDYNDPTFPKNVKPIVYDTAQAAFLAGYLAAGTSKTGKVATFGGINIPTVTIFMDGFADGVKYYNEKKGKSVQLIGWDKDKQDGTFVGDFKQVDKGKVLTQGFLDQGAAPRVVGVDALSDGQELPQNLGLRCLEVSVVDPALPLPQDAHDHFCASLSAAACGVAAGSPEAMACCC